MKLPQILLLGAGGHARACIDVIELEGRHAIGGLVGLPSEIGAEVYGYRVLGSDSILSALSEDYSEALVAVGQIMSSMPRSRLFAAARALGYEFPRVVSPSAYVSKRASIGAGTIVMHGAVINAGAIIGCNCIINSLALVEHDVRVGDHCHISTGANVNGGATIGHGTFIGSNSVVRENVAVGSEVVIGMGLAVSKDCAEGLTLSANPGK